MLNKSNSRGNGKGARFIPGAIGCTAMKIRKSWWIVGGLGLLGVASAVTLIPALRAAGLENRCLQATRALNDGDFARAESVARQLVLEKAESLEVEKVNELRRVAARAAAELGSISRATEYLHPLLKSGDSQSLKLLSHWGWEFVLAGKPERAEQLFHLALTYDGQNEFVHEKLYDLMVAEGRRFRAHQQRLFLFQHNGYSHQRLLAAIDPQLAPLNDQSLAARRAAPAHPLIQLGTLRDQLNADSLATFIPHLKQLVARRPACLEALALLGQALAVAEEPSEFEAWRQALPAAAKQHPGIWHAFALWSVRHDQPRAAIRCYWESLRRQVDNREVYAGLVPLLEKVEFAQVEQYRHRLHYIRELEKAGKALSKNPKHPMELRRAMTLCEQMGRYWEAWGWVKEMARVDANDVTCGELERRIRGLLADDLPAVAASRDPACRFKLDRFPLPDWKAPTEFTQAGASSVSTTP